MDYRTTIKSSTVMSNTNWNLNEILWHFMNGILNYEDKNLNCDIFKRQLWTTYMKLDPQVRKTKVDAIHKLWWNTSHEY